MNVDDRVRIRVQLPRYSTFNGYLGEVVETDRGARMVRVSLELYSDHGPLWFTDEELEKV